LRIGDRHSAARNNSDDNDAHREVIDTELDAKRSARINH